MSAMRSIRAGKRLPPTWKKTPDPFGLSISKQPLGGVSPTSAVSTPEVRRRFGRIGILDAEGASRGTHPKRTSAKVSTQPADGVVVARARQTR